MLGADLAVVTLRDRATPVTLEQAVRRFREQVPSEVGPSTTADASTTSGLPFADVGAAPGPPPTRPTVAGASAAPPSPAVTDPRPASGVYRYRTSGGEEVPFINASRSYPDQTTSTVVREGDGCAWSLRVDLLAEHTDGYQLCTTADAVSIPAFSITIEWFFIRQGIELRCAPAMPVLAVGSPPGDLRTTRCEAEDIGATIRITDRGTASLTIGGTAVPAARLALHMDIDGRFEGAGDYQLWLHPTSGLVLRMVRHVDAKGETPIGRQRYVEHHETTLLSLTPST